jgi:hypothetical protein
MCSFVYWHVCIHTRHIEEQILVSGLISKFDNSKVRFSVFTMLHVLGNCMYCIIFESFTAGGYDCAFYPFIIGLIQGFYVFLLLLINLVY